MKKIDDELGGTTPLNIILNFLKQQLNRRKKMMNLTNGKKKLKMNEDKAKNIGLLEIKWIKLLKCMITRVFARNWQSSLFGSILRVAEDLNKKELQSLEIAVLYSKIPEAIKKEIISPYISVEKDEARVNVRIKDHLKIYEEMI